MCEMYQQLIGKSKDMIISELGFEFNYYPSDVWIYLLKTNWIGRKTFLIIFFKEDMVEEILIKNAFRKLKIESNINH